MEIAGEGVDDILMELYKKLLSSTSRNNATRGDTLEILGVSMRMTKPRARLSRSENRGKPFSALGELLWYLAGSDQLSFIENYIPEYKKDAIDNTVHGAYGPRLFAMRGEVNQIENVTKRLREKPTTRRAVIQLFNAEDIMSDYKEVPCTTTLQFHLRDNYLHLSSTLRSNDAYWGLPHDIFCFTMLQEMMARRLGAELGEYYQYVGSMHIYTRFQDQVQRYVDEGYQRFDEMPAMPLDDPFRLIGMLLKAEARIRSGERVAAADTTDEPYWADIIRLLQVFWASGHNDRLDELEREFAHPAYRSYLESRRNMRPRLSDARAEA